MLKKAVKEAKYQKLITCKSYPTMTFENWDDLDKFVTRKTRISFKNSIGTFLQNTKDLQLDSFCGIQFFSVLTSWYDLDNYHMMYPNYDLINIFDDESEYPEIHYDPQGKGNYES